MMATVQWGRKEAIIWSPRGYVYTLGAVSSRSFCRGQHPTAASRTSFARCFPNWVPRGQSHCLRSGCDFVKQFDNPHQEDIVLRPLDARMPCWNLSK